MKNKKLVLAVIALVAVAAVFLGIYLATRPDTTQGAKTITVTVIHSDGSSKDFTYHTDEEKLGALLEKEGLIASEGADDGMFHTVDGEKADWNENQSYWAFYVGEEYAMTGIYDTPIADGDAFKLVYTVG